MAIIGDMEGVRPAGDAVEGTPSLSGVRGVVFDMDGTLTDSPLDFGLIRAECGIPEGRPILEFLAECPDADRERMLEVLHRHERRAAQQWTLRHGALEVTEALARAGVRTALLTRNSREALHTVLTRFGLRFDCCMSREDGEPKPSPEPVLEIARKLGLAPDQLLVVGDYLFDVQSGHAAGAKTAFINTPKALDPPAEADVVIDDLREILDLVGCSGPMD